MTSPQPKHVVRVVVESAGAPSRATQLAWSGWHPTVGDLAQAVGFDARQLWVDGRECLADELIDGLDLHDGAILSDTAPEPAQSVVAAASGALSIEHVAGYAAGADLAVASGPIAARPCLTSQASSQLSLAEAPPSSPQGSPVGPSVVFDLIAEPGGPERTPSTPDRIAEAGPDGDSVSGRRTWHAGEFRRLGDDLFALRRRDTDVAALTPGAGLVQRPHVLHRSPRLPAEPDDVTVELPSVPTEPDPPPRLSWAVLLAPLPIGILVAVLFRPLFLLFTALGPVMALARWYEGWLRHRRASVRWRAEVVAADIATTRAIDTAAKAYAKRLRDRSPSLATLARRTHGVETGLWERRRSHDDFGEVVIGYHDVAWEPPLAGSGSVGEITAVASTIPHVLRFGDGTVVGVVGPRDKRRAVVRSLLVQLVALHGPADLAVRVASPGHARGEVRPAPPREWDWCKWLPHLAVSHHGVGDRLAVTLGADEAQPGAAIVEADSVELLPARCTQVVIIEDRTARVLDLIGGSTVTGVLAVGCSRRFAADIARELAPVRDSEAKVGGASIPATVALVDLVGVTTVGIGERWADPSARTCAELVVTLGSDGSRVDVDLVADGPHMLVAGTTGSGKSELLRTLVSGLCLQYPPARCSFVLVDFKGGGAFDALEALPHVAAVVTDLDGDLAERALRSLRAELRSREHHLRAVGVSDLRDCPVSADTPPRLVIVVDEFATLADSSPDFLDGLIDTAQRGRSLGVHLVLATQRPAGVVDNRIRSNTNLRVCLRVASVADSRDVIDSGDAAELPTSAVGRAWLRIGAEPARLFQCAHIGTGEPTPQPGCIVAAPFTLADAASEAAPGAWDTPVPDDATAPVSAGVDTSPVVRALVGAASGAGVTANAAPWLAPLPEALATDDLWGETWTDSDALPLARVDLTDERRQPAWTWHPGDGALAVIGGTDRERAALARLIEQAVMHREVRHGITTGGVVVIGSSAGATTTESKRIAPNDVERVGRALDWFGRRPIGHDRPAPTLIIEDYGRVGADSDSGERGALVDRVCGYIAAAGSDAAVVVMAAHERLLPARLLAGCTQRIILTLADPAGYGAFGIRVRDLPELGHLGGIDAVTGHRVRLGTPSTSHVVTSPTIDVLPTRIELFEPRPDAFAPAHTRSRTTESGPLDVRGAGSTEVTIGLSIDDLTAVRVALGGRPLLVVGGQGSGKTATLAMIVHGIRRAVPDTRVCVVCAEAQTTSPWRASDGLRLVDACAVDSTSLRFSGGEIVVVDDADTLSTEVASEVVAALAREPSAAAIVAASAALVRSPRSPWAPMASARFAVVLGRGAQAAEVFGVRPTWYPGTRAERGDSVLIDGDAVVPTRLHFWDGAQLPDDVAIRA